MIVSDYIGRTIDVLAFRGGNASGQVLLNATLADAESSGEITTGIQKLAQRWIITMLTELGSVTYKPEMGTTFMTQLRAGEVHSDADMRALFTLTELSAREQLQNEITTTTPLDEQYLSASLEAVTVSNGNISITVNLYSKSPENTATFIMPIPLII
tara:strand:- start:316 stop:786 length:471 start_codon:yes stop_codon:yes gene_type:complete